MDAYEAFLAGKAPRAASVGIEPGPMPDCLLDFAAFATSVCLRRGRAALFFDTGMTKTRCQLEFSEQAAGATNGYALILTPLAVTRQFEREGLACGYDVRVVRDASEVQPGINICNYDRLDKLDCSTFGSVSLDESSAIANFSGKLTRALINAFADTPFRLCASATPAPNDHVELGTHAEFLGIMSQSDMLIRWFINDSNDTGTWRLKKHATEAFWDWVSSWAVMASSPEDLGFDGSRFVLPPLHMHRHKAIGEVKPMEGNLFAGDVSATNMFAVKRETATVRAQLAASLICPESLDTGKNSTTNTATTDLQNPRQIPVGHPMKTGNICEPTTPPTKSDGRKGLPKNRLNTTKTDGKSMPQTQITEPASTLLSHPPICATESDIKAESYARASALTLPNTPDFLLSNMDDVPSVELQIPEDTDICTLTTTIRQASSEDFFAKTAIEESGNSKTTQIGLSQPLPICEARQRWVVWVDTDHEQKAVETALGQLAISITGSMTPETKERLHEDWLSGKAPVILTKPSIFGQGVNWQACSNVIFVGRSFSYRMWYQAVRRCWRFGQTRPVHVHIIVAEGEDQIGRILDRKAQSHADMKEAMINASRRGLQAVSKVRVPYKPIHVGRLPVWLKSGE